MAWAVLFSLMILVAVLVSGRLSPAVAFVTLAAGYLLAGLVDTTTLLQQYTNPALATLLLLLLVSQALERSPWLSWLLERLLRGSAKGATTRLVGTTAILSAFLNNTAVVAAFLGVLSLQTRIAPSRLLLPLSYASILGGITTLVGTSTHLVINSFVLEATGRELIMFQFSLVGVPVALLCLVVVIWRARSLPHHDTESAKEQLSYFLAADIQANSPLVGRSIEANGLRRLDGLYLLEIERGGHLMSPVGPAEILEAGDTLVFTGDVQNVQALKRFAGLRLFGDYADNLLASNLVEVAVSHESSLIHQTLQDVDFRSMFDAGVVAIRRGSKRLEGQLGKIPLRAGDSLLLAAGPDFHQQHNVARHFHLLSGGTTRAPLTPWQSGLAVGGFASAIGLASVGLVPLFHGLLVLLGVLLVSQATSVSELRRRFPFELWLIIGSALAIAQGLENSGAATLLAQGMQQLFSPWGVYAALIGCYLLTVLLTETVTNNAAAALGFPIAWSTAQAFGVDPTAFIMVVAYGASACFLLPYGYQTHLMVYSSGRYRMKDFIRTGVPVLATYSVAILVLIPLAFPL